MRIRTAADAEKCRERLAPANYRDLPDIGSLSLLVSGAGFIEIGQRTAWCGSSHGLSVYCSWSRHGYSGGVMDRAMLKELRDHIDAFLNGELEIIDEPEEVEPDASIEANPKAT